jgi:hypothetical protein
MEILARKRAEREVAALQQRLAEREERMEDERENVEILSHSCTFFRAQGQKKKLMKMKLLIRMVRMSAYLWIGLL